MAPLRLFSLGAALLGSLVSAQSDGSPRVWAAVAFVNHGERTPATLGDLQAVLTPEGAQQMWRQGAALRSRYLESGPSINGAVSSDALSSDVGSAPIENIQANVIDNHELTVLSQTDEWVAGGAMAFLQGLYPATNQTYNSEAGGMDMAHNWATDTNITNYPLDGYQYPLIETLSIMDSSSPIIQGTEGCYEWDREMKANLTKQDDMVDLADSTFGFYQQLFATEPLKGTVDMGLANLWYASDIYDFVNYMYGHNETVYKGLKNANDTLATLQANAFALETAMNSETSTDEDDPINILRTIAGRTLAQAVAQQFVGNIGFDGVTTKLTLMFGSFRPMLAFFSLAGLLTRENTLSGPFSKLPEPGAAMVFELIGEDPDSPDQLPTFDALSIRFYYRANADDGEELTNYPLFDSGFDGASIPYSSFVDNMQGFGRNTAEWCGICQPGYTIPWCSAYESSDSDKPDGDKPSSRSGLDPAIAGLIGAIVMAVVLALVAVLMYALLGFRVQRAPAKERNSSLGGFKGAEKMASDTDLAVTKVGAGHERVGSWELRDDAPPVTTTAGIVTSDFRKNDDNDSINVMGAAPVKAHESV